MILLALICVCNILAIFFYFLWLNFANFLDLLRNVLRNSWYYTDLLSPAVILNFPHLISDKIPWKPHRKITHLDLLFTSLRLHIFFEKRIEVLVFALTMCVFLSVVCLVKRNHTHHWFLLPFIVNVRCFCWGNVLDRFQFRIMHVEDPPKSWEARSRRFRRRGLQRNTRWKDLEQIYKMYMVLHRSDSQFSRICRKWWILQVFFAYASCSL